MKAFRIILFCSFFLGIETMQAQGFYLRDTAYNKYELPSILIGPAFTSYRGDYNNANVFFNASFNTGIYAAAEYRINDMFGANISGTFSKLTQNEIDMPARNFQTKLTEVSLRGIFYFDNNLIIPKTSGFSSFVFIGAGIMNFKPKADLKDKNGNTYHFWRDGTIRDRAYDSQNPLDGNIIQRDYIYETVLDSAGSISKTTLSLPIGLGIKLKISDRIESNLSLAYAFTGTDYIDYYKPDQKSSIFKGNDGYWSFAVTFQYNLSGKSFFADDKLLYADADPTAFNLHEDEDGDGVPDIHDRCPQTPPGVQVDKFGCPIDTDGDGIPDYLDKEPNSLPDALVDNFGVTITEQMMYEYYIRDSLLTAGYYPEDLLKDKEQKKGAYAYLDDKGTKKQPAETHRKGSTTLEAGKTFYTVQVSSSANMVEDEFFFKNFNIRDKIYVTEASGIYRYNIGAFESRQQADEFLYNVKNTYLLDNPFINTMTSDNVYKELVVSQDFINSYLAKRESQKDKIPEIKAIPIHETGLVYRIQISSRAVKLPPEFFMEKFNIYDEVFESFQDGAYKYAIGNFKTYKQAREYNIEFQNQYNLKGTYVTPYNNGKRITVQEALKIQQENQ